MKAARAFPPTVPFSAERLAARDRVKASERRRSQPAPPALGFNVEVERHDDALHEGMQQVTLDFHHEGKEVSIVDDGVVPTVEPRHVRSFPYQSGWAARQRRTR